MPDAVTLLATSHRYRVTWDAEGCPIGNTDGRASTLPFRRLHDTTSPPQVQQASVGRRRPAASSQVGCHPANQALDVGTATPEPPSLAWVQSPAAYTPTPWFVSGTKTRFVVGSTATE